MPYRRKADWEAVDWCDSDRPIAARLGVSRSAVTKQRNKIGHASDYTVDVTLLRWWFEGNRTRLPQMSDRDIEIEVFDDLKIIDFSLAHWKRFANPRSCAKKARRATAEVLDNDAHT